METLGLERFVEAQQDHYHSALRELRSGAKRGHWMWYIFPQMRGLGLSHTSLYYGIADSNEAQSYLVHPVLGPRLLECTRAVLALGQPDLTKVFPPPDDLKFASCMTLFALQPHAPSEYQVAVDQLLGGKKDEKTIELLKIGAAT